MQTQQLPQLPQVADQSCVNRSLWGWSPPPLAADTPVKRLVDRWLPRTGFELIVFYAVIVLMLNFALHLPRRGELALDGTAALLAGAWCALNFWRCRHAHCVVTASGWLVLALLAFGEADLGRSLMHGDEQLIFLAVLPVGVAFEFAWSRARGSNAIGGCLPA